MTGPPVLDGRRAFYGRPQLTDYENRVLARIAGGELLWVICERGGRAYYIGGKVKVRATTAQRLIARRYLTPRDLGLFPDVESAQTFEVSPYEQEMGPSPCDDGGEPECNRKEFRTCQEMEAVQEKSMLRKEMERQLRPERQKN